MSLAEGVIVLAIWAMYAGEEGIDFPEIEIPPVQQEGSASWYGSENGTNDGGMHGAITASGELFTPSDQTCASRNIPLNTMVLIEVVATGKKAWCRVNDRGPYGFVTEDTGEWVALWPRRGEWILRRRNSGGGWLSEEFYSTKPKGKYRGLMDLSRGTAEALDFDFRAGLNTIRIHHYNSQDMGGFTLQALD